MKNFEAGPEQVLHIAFDYRVDSHHFALLMSIVHNHAAGFRRRGKKVLVVLQLSRSFCENAEHIKEVSFLNGFDQLFIEHFKPAQAHLSAPNFRQAVLTGSLDLEQLLPQAAMNCLIRFDFRLAERDDNVNSGFIKHRNMCHTSPRVVALLSQYITERMKRNPVLPSSSQVINPTLNFRKELLTNKEILLMCNDTQEAAKYLVHTMLEEYATLFFKELVEKQAFISVIPEAASEMLVWLVEGFRGWYPTVQDYDEQLLKAYVFSNLTLSQSIRASKSPNSI